MNTGKLTMRVLTLLALVTFETLLSCSKEGEDNNDCTICKALNNDGSIAGQAEVCSEADATTFRNAHPDNEIVCN